MADETTAAPASTEAPSSMPPAQVAGAPAYVQLTQAWVPLDDAGEAFSVPDENGRLPIVILPKQPFRIRNEFVLGGVVVIVVGFLLDLDLAYRTGLIVIGLLSIFLGVFRSFLVHVPEGSRAILLKGGRLWKSIGPGRHVVPPWIVVSHLVTTREIPFDSPATEVPTRDGVRVNVDILVTFLIDQPEKFVYAISAPDFDQVLQAASLDAVRTLIRGIPSSEVLDLSGRDSAALMATIAETITEYGVTAHRVVITTIRPPLEFVASLESRQLAAFQRAEQDERQALEERRQGDRALLEQQRLTAQRQALELEAANETYRLEQLEERIRTYPLAARHDIDTARLEVARALAGNTRAMLSVGPGSDVASALVMRDVLGDGVEGADEKPRDRGGAAASRRRPAAADKSG